MCVCVCVPKPCCDAEAVAAMVTIPASRYPALSYSLWKALSPGSLCATLTPSWGTGLHGTVPSQQLLRPLLCWISVPANFLALSSTQPCCTEAPKGSSSGTVGSQHQRVWLMLELSIRRQAPSWHAAGGPWWAEAQQATSRALWFIL